MGVRFALRMTTSWSERCSAFAFDFDGGLSSTPTVLPKTARSARLAFLVKATVAIDQDEVAALDVDFAGSPGESLGMSTLLAIDFGERRTGVAVVELETGVVAPMRTLDRRCDDALVAQLESLAQEYEAGGFVVGLPLLLDGSEGPASSRVRSFAEKLARGSQRPIHFVCETLTSHEARERIALASSSGQRGRRSRSAGKGMIDAVAAQIIGEQFLASGQGLSATASRSQGDEGG